MKKQTSYVVIAFLLGIIVTQFFLTRNSKVSSTAPSAQQNEIKTTGSSKTTDAQAATTLPAPAPEVQKSMELLGTAQVNSISEKTEQAASKKMHSLTVNEENVTLLENNLQELTHQVVMQKEPRGWRVKYLNPENPMANIGLNNDDLVLSELIDAGKADPQTNTLMTRLENVFSQLQE